LQAPLPLSLVHKTSASVLKCHAGGALQAAIAAKVESADLPSARWTLTLRANLTHARLCNMGGAACLALGHRQRGKATTEAGRHQEAHARMQHSGRHPPTLVDASQAVPEQAHARSLADPSGLCAPRAPGKARPRRPAWPLATDNAERLRQRQAGTNRCTHTR